MDDLAVNAIGNALARMADALESLADTQRLHLKLLAGERGAPIADIRAALEAEAADAAGIEQAQAASPGAKHPRSGTDLIQLLTQDQGELDTLHRAHAAAERDFGRGNVPDNLDLYSYAEENGLTEAQRPGIDEPVSNVPPAAPVGPAGT
jgi:hypothetical protein